MIGAERESPVLSAGYPSSVLFFEECVHDRYHINRTLEMVRFEEHSVRFSLHAPQVNGMDSRPHPPHDAGEIVVGSYAQ